jgi:hypothetical protein
MCHYGSPSKMHVDLGVSNSQTFKKRCISLTPKNINTCKEIHAVMERGWLFQDYTPCFSLPTQPM